MGLWGWMTTLPQKTACLSPDISYISVVTEMSVIKTKEQPMTLTVWTYLVYLAISVALTVWVAQTLHKNGRVFLIDCFHGHDHLADSVNHLLVVGFYLINVGFVTLALKYGVAATTPQQ